MTDAVRFPAAVELRTADEVELRAMVDERGSDEVVTIVLELSVVLDCTVDVGVSDVEGGVYTEVDEVEVEVGGM